MDYSRRRAAVLERIDGTADGLLATTPANVRYLTGFSGTNGWLLLLAGDAVFLTDPRYATQAEQLGGLSVVVSSEGLTTALSAALEGRAVDALGFEPEQVSVSTKSKLDDAFEGAWIAVDSPVEGLRRSKDDDEVAAIRAALAVTESALEAVADDLAPGWTEMEVAAELERACRRAGAESMAFETIVASGPRSALPHGVASDRTIGPDEPVMIDMGCRLDGYCADLTRMLWCGGSPSDRFLELHELVDRAREAALAAVRPGVPATEVDAAARDVIAGAGYGEAFRHGTGHGVGLEIHEAPKVSKRSVDQIEEGMVLTIEPGVYLDGELGVRIEDLARVTGDGCQRLTTLGTEPILRGST